MKTHQLMRGLSAFAIVLALLVWGVATAFAGSPAGPSALAPACPLLDANVAALINTEMTGSYLPDMAGACLSTDASAISSNGSVYVQNAPDYFSSSALAQSAAPSVNAGGITPGSSQYDYVQDTPDYFSGPLPRRYYGIR